MERQQAPGSTGQRREGPSPPAAKRSSPQRARGADARGAVAGGMARTRSCGSFLLLSLLWLAALAAIASARMFKSRRIDFSQIPKTTRIQVYYESLCPYSIAFITEQLWPTYVRVGYLMDVQLIPFGNAFKEQQQQSYVDQASTYSRKCCERHM
ncbi:hypothetical protein V5799_028994 [Amblyomma americanum]|uniref:Gamma-interferon inducible lysosomal thiol reductase n=1 Tax=Amblyomma americanum TaxID=6943 RepID=A0AAQ4ESC8_AMBAM